MYKKICVRKKREGEKQVKRRLYFLFYQNHKSARQAKALPYGRVQKGGVYVCLKVLAKG